MATKFPKFSQSLAQDPTTRRIWYSIATAHDFESHDGVTEESLYQKNLCFSLWPISYYFSLDIRKSFPCSMAR